MKERIQKVLGNAGVASRRQIEAMLLDGRVAVNGKVVRKLPVLIDPAVDHVQVDGTRVRLRAQETQNRYYFLLNKPAGVYCTNVAQGAQVRAVDLLPKSLKARLYPVGRLDADSKGLLLLTNDGELTNQLTHPRYGVSKTYRVTVEGQMTPGTLERLRTGGFWLADKNSGKGFKTGPCQAKIITRTPTRTVLEISIHEGRNRQVRRMLVKLGHKVRELVRIRIGPLTLEGLPPGKFRPLTAKELSILRATQAQPRAESGKGARRKPGVADEAGDEPAPEEMDEDFDDGDTDDEEL